MLNKDKLKIEIHIEKEEIKKFDEYIKLQQLTNRKKMIEFLVLKFIKNIK